MLYYQSEVYSPLYPNHNTKGEPIVIGGVRYEHGLEFSVNGVASFAIPSGYGSFHAAIGVSDDMSNDAATGVIFIVRLDGSPVYRSDVIRPSSRGPEINIPIGKAWKIELIAIDAADKGQEQRTKTHSRAVWMNARLTAYSEAPL